MNSIIEHKADTKEFKPVISLWTSVMPVVVIRPFLKWEHIGSTEAHTKNDIAPMPSHLSSMVMNPVNCY
jgi:hypothetical protein